MTTTIERPTAVAPVLPPSGFAPAPVTYTMRFTDGTEDNLTWTLSDVDAMRTAEQAFNRKVQGERALAYSVTSEGPTVIRTFDPAGDIVVTPQIVGG